MMLADLLQHMARYVLRSTQAIAHACRPEKAACAHIAEQSCLLQNWWDGIEEKPAAIAIGVGALVVLWATSGLVDAIDRLPIIGGLLEIVGQIVTSWCALCWR